MGGHGGLNILPQKRWNVYGRDNRLKVARDEAAHAAQQAEQDEKHRAAEAQARRQLLLERAKERRQAALGGHADALERSAGGSASDADVELALQHEQLSAGQRKPSAHARQQQGSAHTLLDDTDGRAHKRIRVQEDPQDYQQLQVQQHHHQGQQLSTADDVQEEPALKHINFWEELETKAQHPERQAEERAKKKRRGDSKTHTSDERFDESFQFANGLTGLKPWYARATDRSAADRLPPQQQGRPQQQLLKQQPPNHPSQQAALPAADDSCKRSRRRRHSSISSSSSGSDSDSSSSSSSSSSDSEGGRKRRKHRRHKHNGSGSKSKEHRRTHRKSKDKGSRHRSRSAAGKAAADEDAAKALALAKLRAERLEREAAERHRALQATGLLPPTTKRFNSSFGYAEALRQNQVGAIGMAAAARGASAAAVAGLSQRFRG